MDTTAKIYSAMIGVMSDIGAICKDKRNTTQGFNFRGIDDVYNALQPALIKHGVFVVPEVLESTREDRVSSKGAALIYSVCKVRYTFFADDGSHISAIVVGEGMDSGDKATNKALSIAFKYACFQAFCIPTEEIIDPDAESYQVRQNQATAQPSDRVDTAMINSVFAQLQRTGVGLKGLLANYKLSDIREMTLAQYRDAMDSLQKKPDKQAPPPPPPAEDECGLPFR